MIPEKLNILQIGNDAEDNAFLKSILKQEEQIDIKLSWKKNLKDGIKFCKGLKNKVDIVLLDLFLPDCDGLATIKLFANTLPQFPVIILAGSEDVGMARGALTFGAQDYIIKGQFERTLLVKSLLYSIERQRLKLKYRDQKEDLEQIEDKLQTIITTDLDGILIIDHRGHIRFSNPTAEKIMAMPASRLIGELFGIPLLGDNNIAEIEVHSTQKTPVLVELQMVDINWRGMDAYLCTMRDITEQRSTETAIKENEEKFMAVAGSSSDAIIHFDESQNIVFINFAAEEIFGIQKKDVLEIGLHYVFKNNPDLLKIIDNLGTVASKQIYRDITGFRENEDSFPMEVSLTTFKRKGKRQVVCIIRDTTERRRAENDLMKTRQQLVETQDELKSNRQKLVEVEKLNSVKELAGAISHEFAQPLQALYNYLHLIQNVEARDEYFEKSREMLNRISELTTNLKNITTIHKMDYLESKILDLFASSEPGRKVLKSKILVVDDEREILETMMDIFKNAGYLCKGASDGKEAFELIQNEAFDLILCDVMMPRMNGVDLLRNIKRIKYKTQFIFLTGYDIPLEYEEMVHEANYTIQKPISFNDLLNYVENALYN
ncbi:MAG: response regulator [Calditrichaeota bacterium]|nr:MAG: response regulator [Calditrichota bacterium]MBL1206015.1 response regulator [Calditrichota bacterium]NOG45843.1 response regulator [Calditrichota bacterium]